MADAIYTVAASVHEALKHAQKRWSARGGAGRGGGSGGEGAAPDKTPGSWGYYTDGVEREPLTGIYTDYS